MADRSFSGPDGFRHAGRPDRDGRVFTLCGQRVGTESFRVWPLPGWAEHVAPVTCLRCERRLARYLNPEPAVKA